MYHGLEVRVPLIDVRMLELASALPRRQRLRRGSDGRWVGKALLKRVLAKSFPQDFVYRKKQGFSIPRDRWFLPGNCGRKMLEESLRAPNSPLREWFRSEAIEEILASHTPTHDASSQLWLLLVLSIWVSQNPGIQFNGTAQ
jgi:asparagine synthase (glutamine-hydrolysing)